jgi:hypothetical protein
MTFFKGLRCTFGCEHTFGLDDPYTYDILEAKSKAKEEAENWLADTGWYIDLRNWNGMLSCQDHVAEWEDKVYAAGNDSDV